MNKKERSDEIYPDRPKSVIDTKSADAGGRQRIGQGARVAGAHRRILFRDSTSADVGPRVTAAPCRRWDRRRRRDETLRKGF